jgi:hypothetical protein
MDLTNQVSARAWLFFLFKQDLLTSTELFMRTVPLTFNDRDALAHINQDAHANFPKEFTRWATMYRLKGKIL